MCEHMGGLRGQPVELVLSFHLYLSLGTEYKLSGLLSKCLGPVNHLTSPGECKMIRPLWKTIHQCLKKLTLGLERWHSG